MVDLSFLGATSGVQSISPVKGMKKWMSEPTLLGDYEDGWLKECKEVEEDSISFTEEVAQPSLTHVTKERVQFRPKRRRPPSRDFLRSRASMDFDISIPEEIKEEDELQEKDKTVEEAKNEAVKEDSPVKLPVPPPKPPKETTGWKLPTIDLEVKLKKTPVTESKTIENGERENNATKSIATSEESNDIPESPMKQKRRHKLRLPFIPRFNRSRRGKDNNKNGPQPERENMNSNLSKPHYGSVDSGSRPLGDGQQKRWRPGRRRKADDARNLSWLLALFHRKNSSSAQSTSGGPPVENGNHGDTNLNNIRDVEKEKCETNRNVPGNKMDEDFTNGNTPVDGQSHDNPESFSDLRKKFEKISGGY